MFDNDFSIIKGNYSSGKSKFIFSFAHQLKSVLGYKICYISAVKETGFSDPSLNSIFEFVRFYDHDIRTAELISEIVIRDKYDFIFIDDIDHIVNFKKNEWINVIAKIPVAKIATYSVFPPFSKEKIEICDSSFKVYNMNNGFIDGQSANIIIEQFIRDKKIEKICKQTTGKTS